MKLEFSPQARMDLIDILNYIAQDKPNAAIKFVDDLEKQCNVLLTFPTLGTNQSHIADHLRVYCYRGYGLYFRYHVADELVRIERVLGAGMKIGPELFNS